MQGWSVIRLHREQGFYRDRRRAYRVRIDGNVVGKVAEGETKDFFVPPGEHRVRFTIDGLWSSREVTFQVGADELTEFICYPSASVTTSFVLAWVCPHRYIRLDGPVVSRT